jgi:hypothetical protein
MVTKHEKAELERLDRLTNEEFISELMTFSPYGGIQQAFVIEAIRNYSERVCSRPEPASDRSEFIDPQYWHKIATHVHTQFLKKYEPQEYLARLESASATQAHEVSASDDGDPRGQDAGNDDGDRPEGPVGGYPASEEGNTPD